MKRMFLLFVFTLISINSVKLIQARPTVLGGAVNAENIYVRDIAGNFINITVEDVLAVAIAHKPDAVVLDFFAGSGTTAHAVMRLNRRDGGRRRSVVVTNNEVAADEQKALRDNDLRPGDPDWEQWGICDHITKPRIEAAINGRTPDDDPIKGDYRFSDEFPMADGLEENVEFFTATCGGDEARVGVLGTVRILGTGRLDSGGLAHVDPRASRILPHAAPGAAAQPRHRRPPRLPPQLRPRRLPLQVETGRRLGTTPLPGRGGSSGYGCAGNHRPTSAARRPPSGVAPGSSWRSARRR